jgi:hypothetical protein
MMIFSFAFPKTTTLPETRVTTTNNTQRPNTTSSQEKTTISQGCFVQGEVSGTNDVSVEMLFQVFHFLCKVVK